MGQSTAVAVRAKYWTVRTVPYLAHGRAAQLRLRPTSRGAYQGYCAGHAAACERKGEYMGGTSGLHAGLRQLSLLPYLVV